jgi:broad specificity phosphatase PhoE
MWVSPYKRTRETGDIIMAEAGKYIHDVQEHILLGEQQFGLFEVRKRRRRSPGSSATN